MCIVSHAFSKIQVKPLQVDEDANVDILTTEKVAAFSDNEESVDGFYFLPTLLDRDVSPTHPPVSPVDSPNTASVPRVVCSMTPSNTAGSQGTYIEPDDHHTGENFEGQLNHTSRFPCVNSNSYCVLDRHRT